MGFSDLFKPKWKHSKWRVRLDAVKRITDQALLAEIAKNDQVLDVCIAATDSITDKSLAQNIYTEIIYNNYNLNLDKAWVNWLEDLVNRLDDQTSLLMIAKNSHIESLCMVAVKKLTEQSFLAEIAKKENVSEEMAQVLLNKISDKSLLREIAKTANKRVRWIAIPELHDQDILSDIAINDPDDDIRWKSVCYLTNQSVLGNIVMNDKSKQVRERALLEITDQTVLARIAKSEKNYFDDRKTALCRLTDQAVLSEIARLDGNAYLRSLALGNLSDRTVIAEIAENDKNIGNRVEALDKLIFLGDMDISDQNKKMVLPGIA